MNFLDLSFLYIFLGLNLFAVFFYIYKWQKAEKKVKAMHQHRLDNVVSDLELATNDQLFEALKGRSNHFVVLRPKFNENDIQLDIGIFNMPAIAAAGIISLAAEITQKSLKSDDDYGEQSHE